MKNDIPRLVPVWLLPIVILVFFLAMQCGCRTGGTKLNTNSSGIKSVVSSSNLVRQSNGVYKLEPVQPKQVKLHPAKSRPKSSPAVSAEPTINVPPVSAAGKPAPFEPTVSPSKEQKMPPLNPKVNVIPLKPEEPVKKIVGDGGCVKPENWCGTKDPQIAGPCEAVPQDDASTVNWSELILFYLASAVGLFVLWLSYALYRDWRKVQPAKKPAKPITKKRKPKVKKSK
jgi:hypothetical protein